MRAENFDMPIVPHRARCVSRAARLLATCAVAIACNISCNADSSGDAPAPATDHATPVSGARAGIDWLVDHADAMPPGWAHTYLLRLHRLAPDETMAARIEAALRADPEGRRASPLPRRLGQRRVLQTRQLVPLLFELTRRKDLGIPIRKEQDALQAILKADEGRFWKPIKATQRLVLLHLFAELGLEPPRDPDQTVRELKRELAARPPEDVASDDEMLYALTHVIMTESGYFQERPDPERVAFTIPHLFRGLQRALDDEDPARSLDLIAEIVGCLTFVGVAAEGRIDAARQRILDAQQRDGSWGEGTGATAKRIHLSLNAVTATIEWPARPRPDPDLRL